MLSPTVNFNNVSGAIVHFDVVCASSGISHNYLIYRNLLKERWSLIQNGHSRKSIKLNSQRSCIYLNNQLYGKVINSQFQRSTQTIPTPQNITSHPQQMDQSPLINLSSPNLVTSDPSQSTTTTQVSSDK